MSLIGRVARFTKTIPLMWAIGFVAIPAVGIEVVPPGNPLIAAVFATDDLEATQIGGCLAAEDSSLTELAIPPAMLTNMSVTRLAVAVIHEFVHLTAFRVGAGWFLGGRSEHVGPPPFC